MTKQINEAAPSAARTKKAAANAAKKPEFAKEYGVEAYERIAEIARNGENEKIRFDASKWLVEMAFGKAERGIEPEGEKAAGEIKITLKGELKEWAK